MAKRRRGAMRRGRRRSGGIDENLFFGFLGLAFLGALFKGVDMFSGFGIVAEYVRLIMWILGASAASVLLFLLGRVIVRQLTWYRRQLSKRKVISERFAAARSQRQFHQMSPIEFEHYIGWLYEQSGYRVEVTPGSNDHGIDAKLYKDGTTTVVQVKRYGKRNMVGRPEVQQFVGSMMGYDAGIFVTTSSFTKGATEYAEQFQNLQLINGTELERLTHNL